MRTFTCLMSDHRYAVPTLSFIIAADEARACELARRELMRSQEHISIEVHEDGRCVFAETQALLDQAPGTQAPDAR